jgi:hypothetical protein
MAYVPVPKDLTKVKTKVALNLTKRQLVCFGLAAAAGTPTYLLTKGAAGSSAAALLMIGLMLPFFFFAMFERDGQPAEKILRNVLRAKLWPGTRPYRTENLYKYLSEGGVKNGDTTNPGIAAQNETTDGASVRKRTPGKGK